MSLVKTINNIIAYNVLTNKLSKVNSLMLQMNAK